MPPAELRLQWARLVITLAFVLLWPIFTYGIAKNRHEAAAARKAVAEKAPGPWFYGNLGGCGTITCN